MNRKLLAVSIIILVLGGGSASYYYATTYLPQHSDSDGDGWTDWDELHVYHTDPYTPNPNAKYFVDKGGAVELVAKIAVVDKGKRIVDPQAKEFIDYLFNQNLTKQLSGLASVRNRCIDQILKDGRVTVEEASALHLLSAYSPETQLRYSDFTEDIVKFLYTLTSQKDRGFVDYAIQNGLRMESGTLTDLDIKFLLEPEKYAQEVFDADLKRLSTIRPDVAEELRKLPEFDLKTTGIKEVEANEDIVCRVLRSTRDELKVFDVILREGIPEKRKYCSPLQALVWYAEDNEFVGLDPVAIMFSKDESSMQSVTYRFIDSFWSMTYKSQKWNDFQVVVDRLNSPVLVALYMKHSIIYQGIPDAFQSALETFRKKSGICGDHAMFGAYCLARNGYEAYILSVNPTMDTGHSVTLFKHPREESFFVFDNTAQFPYRWAVGYYVMYGPFGSVVECVDFVAKKAFSGSWIRYTIWDTDWKIVRRVMR